MSALLTWGVTALGSGWQAMWIVSGSLTLAAVLAVAFLVPSLQQDRVRPEPTIGPAHKPRPWPLITAYGLFGFGYVITATFIVAIVRDAPKITRFEPLVWLVVGLAAIPSVAAWTWAGRRFGITRILWRPVWLKPSVS